MKNVIPAVIVALMWLGTATIAQTPSQGKVGVDVTGNPQAQALLGQILQLSDGTYELKIEGSAVTIVPLTWITPDDPVPPPSDLTQRGKEMRAACLQVTGDTAKELNTKKMVALYRQVKLQTDDGRLKEQQTIAIVIKGAQDLLLGKSLDEWSPVTTQFGGHWGEMVEDGRPVGEYADYLGEAADGLESTLVAQVIEGILQENSAVDATVAAAIAIVTPNVAKEDLAQALHDLRNLDRIGLDPATIKLIIELIMMIIDMFVNADPSMQPAVITPDVPVAPATNTTGFRFTPHWETVAA